MIYFGYLTGNSMDPSENKQQATGSVHKLFHLRLFSLCVRQLLLLESSRHHLPVEPSGRPRRPEKEVWLLPRRICCPRDFIGADSRLRRPGASSPSARRRPICYPLNFTWGGGGAGFCEGAGEPRPAAPVPRRWAGARHERDERFRAFLRIISRLKK